MHRRTLLCGLPAAALFTSPFQNHAAFAGGDPLVVIVGPDSKQVDISLSDLRALFKGGAVNGADGAALIPFNLPAGNRARNSFDEAVLGMSPDQAAAYWIDRKIRGSRGAPKALPSADILRAALAKVPSSIGYAQLSEAKGTVRVLTIDGKKPGVGSYPIA